MFHCVVESLLGNAVKRFLCANRQVGFGSISATTSIPYHRVVICKDDAYRH
jgi:uncharacterized protein (UPF0248 family)